MAYSIENLRAKSDAELIAEHDRLAMNTVVGTQYYQDELERRSRERATEAANRLAVRSFWLAVASTVLSVVATIASVAAVGSTWS